MFGLNPLVISIVLGMTLSAAAYVKGHFDGAHQERTTAALAAAKRATERTKELEKNHEEFKKLPPNERCLALARSSGLPDTACN